MILKDEARSRPRPAGYLANRMARLFNQALAQALEPHGLAPAPFLVLLELWKADGLTQRDLGRRLDVEQATMANTLARMARDGLVMREAHPTDKRAHPMRLTEKARMLKKPAKAAARAVNAGLLEGLSRKEEDRFLELLTRVIGTLQADRAARETAARQVDAGA